MAQQYRLEEERRAGSIALSSSWCAQRGVVSLCGAVFRMVGVGSPWGPPAALAGHFVPQRLCTFPRGLDALSCHHAFLHQGLLLGIHQGLDDYDAAAELVVVAVASLLPLGDFR